MSVYRKLEGRTGEYSACSRRVPRSALLGKRKIFALVLIRPSTFVSEYIHIVLGVYWEVFIPRHVWLYGQPHHKLDAALLDSMRGVVYYKSSDTCRVVNDNSGGCRPYEPYSWLGQQQRKTKRACMNANTRAG